MPVLYSFRRCPYAIRARLAVHKAQISVQLREVVLRDKPRSFLEASASGTVPCLVVSDQIFDESLDIMTWALALNDPNQWLEMPQSGWDWISRCDGPFKSALDRTKYATRYPEEHPSVARAEAHAFLHDLDHQIEGWIFDTPTLADYAILPFVRQFAFIDKALFDAQDWPALHSWLAHFLASSEFTSVMEKYPQWKEGDTETVFP